MTETNTQTGRWSTAQAYEEAWWQARVDEINLEYLKQYAERLIANLDGIIDIKDDTRILEIGSGPAGILTFLNSDYKRAIEPLESFFAGIEKFARVRDKRVKYYEGKAEALPFAKNEFNLIIIDNVLDHCEEVTKVFTEMNRVLMSGGIIYMKLNVYHAWGKIVRLLSEKFQIDKGHPHTFTGADLKNHFREHHLTVVKEIRRGIFATWRKQLTSFKPRDLLKAISFSTPDTIIYVLAKKA